MQDLGQKQLFGGAISCNLPTRFVDVSDFRQVPDNQEVFTDINVEQTIIVELLEKVNVSDIKEAAVYHFQEMASLNEATRQEVQVVEVLEEAAVPHLRDFPKAIVFGRQEAGKFNETARNVVDVFLCLVRLDHKDTDLIVSLSSVEVLNPQSSSATQVHHTETLDQSKEMFKAVLASLNVHDWSLFQ